MRKSRFLDGVDYGSARPNGLYRWRSANTTSVKWPFHDWVKDNFLNEHLYYLSTGATNVGTLYWLQGTEVFESSERCRPVYNDCWHTRSRTRNLPFSVCYKYGTGIGRQYAIRFNPGSYVAYLADSPTWDAISDNVRAEAYHTMLPRFEGEISMLNFIFEMKDFRDITGIIKRQLGIVRNKHENAFTRITKRIAEAHLIKNFAIDPLVSDLWKMIGQAQRLVMAVQNEFKEKGLLPDSRHFSKQLSRLQSFVPASGYFGSSDYVTTVKGQDWQQRFTATMEGTYGYTCRSDLNAFCQYWGLLPTAEAVWNALPFSFLVDYIFSIGHSLNVMRHDENVSYHLEQYCESILSEVNSGLFLTQGYKSDLPLESCYYAIDNLLLGGKATREYHFIAGFTSTIYSRRKCSPYWGPFLPRFKLPSDKQSWNVLALARCLL